MQIEVLMLVIFSVLFALSMFMYKYGDKIKFKKKEVEKKPKQKIKKPTIAKAESETPEEKEEEKKTTRPVLLSPAPLKQVPQQPKTEPLTRPRTIDETEINEIRKFIESSSGGPSTRQGLSDYNKIETFGDVIDIDDEFPSLSPNVDFDPYVKKDHHKGESEFLKNRGEEKSLYEELKNMSPEMKKIIMADILKRKQ